MTGLSIGEAVTTGPVCLIESPRDIDRFVDGAILVTRTTDPDWVPIMRRAAAIVTDHGGRTSHAAIVSRELGLPAIVGTGNATEVLHSQQDVTVSCAEGELGFVYEGFADYEAQELDLAGIPETRTQVMLNLANPAAAFRWWRIPADGVGLARMEFVVSNYIKVHPMALVRFGTLTDENAKRQSPNSPKAIRTKPSISSISLARGLARIAAAYHPKPVIVRMSDFKTNEYAESDRRGRVRTHRREPDARVSRRLALLLAALSRRLRARMPRDLPAAGRDGISQCRGHDSRSAVPPRKPTRCSRSWPRTA